MEDPRLLQRLTNFRRTVRTRLVVFGLCAVAAGGTFVFLAAITLDWLLHLPPWPRLVAGVLGAAAIVPALWHWVAKPLLRPIGLAQLAGKLEQYRWRLGAGQATTFDDRLSSAVDFLLGNQAGSEQLRRRVIASTDRIVENIHFRDALSLRPLATCGAALVVAVGLLVVIESASPGYARTGMQRFIAPFSAVRWPRDVEIVPLSGDLAMPAGESTTVRMKVVRGLTPTLRGLVYVQGRDGQVTRLAMQREGPDEFVCNVGAVTGDLVCWFEAGDDHTRDRPIHIRAVPRPAVTEVLASIDPPEYAPGAPSLTVDLQAGEVTAVTGSLATVSVQCSKPVGTEVSGQPTAALEFDSGQTVGLQFGAEGDARSLEASFELEADVRFRVRVVDADGLANRAERTYRIIAEPDRSPGVVVLEPQALVEVTPRGSIEMLVRAEDDFGISALRLVGREINTDTAINIALTERMSVMPAGDRIMALAEFVWDFAPLGLSPGAAVVYQAEAADNYAYRGAGPQIGRSPQGRVKILSQVEFVSRLRDEFGLLQERIRQAMLDQNDLRDQTAALGNQIAPETPPAASQIESVGDLAVRQGRLVKRLGALSDRFRRIGRRVELNNLDNQTLSQQVGELARQLRETAAGPASAASRRLGEAATPNAEDPASRLAEAGEKQAKTAEALAAMIRFMGQWGEFQEAVAKARDLLDRQQAVRRLTAEVGKRTLGQRPESLTEPDQADLRRTERQQSQLADETEQLLEQLRRLTEQLENKDPVGAAALDDALRAGVAADAPQHMRDAADAIEANRLAAAAIEQRTAEAALADMLASLAERRRRELAELAKRIESAREAVQELLRRQREQLEANVEADRLGAGLDVFVKQADQQRTLEGNARRLADDMELLHQVTNPARLVRRSAEPMAEAESALRKPDSQAARDSQGEAADLLAQALTELEEIARKTAEEAWKRSLAALKTRLETIRNAQQDINDESAAIIALATEPGGRIGRKEYRTVRRLAQAQGELHPAVQEVRQQLGEAAVYRWVIDRVLELIGVSRQALEARRLDDQLADSQEQIVVELDVLIEALTEAATLPPPDEYADGQAGGGGGAAGAGEAAGPVPSVAELLVLKSMQLDLNAKTARAARDFDADTASEEQLRELQAIAERQEKIRELTETVTQRAEH